MNKESIAMAMPTARTRAKSLLDSMTSEEKITMLGGVRGFFIPACERLGIPEVFLSDASCGINIRDTWIGEEVNTDLEKSVAFPCFIALASTWNRELCSSYARSVGEEARAAGIHILLGPGMNIYRQSQCGRNFEYLGEDPYLASALVECYVQALQSTGVGATLKHFVANNSDFFRRRSNSILSDRALREMYMPAFQAGIEAGAVAVMTAYNLLNGEWCCQNKQLISTVLRGEMGFDKLVMSDWWGMYDCEKAVKSGIDLEMPKADIFAKIPELLENGSVSMDDIDRMLGNILAVSIVMDFYNPNFADKKYIVQFPQHEEVALQTARESIVLLKNNGVLPLSAPGDDLAQGKPAQKEQSILLTGKYATERIRGGGAAEVEGYNWVMLINALEDVFGASLEYKANPSDAELRSASVVIMSTGTFDSEAWDRPFALPAPDESAVKRAVSLNTNTVVVVQSGSGIRMTDWNESAAAILYCWYGGQNGNQAIAEVIAGRVNPSGKLPISIEREFSHSPAANYLPEGESLYEGWNDEAEAQHPVFNVHYNEGIFVGYRWYESKNIKPLYPFGHGLSYTSFKLSELKLSKEIIKTSELDEGIEVSVTVQNTGSVAGMETVQVYVRDNEALHPRPEKELKGFVKLRVGPGERRRISVDLKAGAFQFWNPETRAWQVEAGTFTIFAGTSSAFVHAQAECRIQ